MATEQPESPPGKPGVVQIVLGSHAGDSTPTSGFSISFGGKRGGVASFYLGRACRLGDLSSLLAKNAAGRGVHAMMGQPSHEIPNVRLSKEFFSRIIPRSSAFQRTTMRTVLGTCDE
jgi:hypothetical protein